MRRIDRGCRLPFLLLLRRVDGDLRLVAIVEKREHPVVLGVRQRIVLVAVALRTLNRQAQHSLADGVHAVEHRFHAELLGIDAALLVDHRVPQEARRHELVLRGLGQQVAGDLLDEELVVRHVLR